MGNCGWFSDNPIDTGKVYGLYGRIKSNVPLSLYGLSKLAYSYTGFQIDAWNAVLSTNQNLTLNISTNQGASLNHHFENQS